MTERKLARVVTIDEINPIEGADAIECASVGGWNIVVKKGEYSVGQLAVYLEIDSWVPHTIAPFLSKGQYPKVYNNVEGERLRTIKLRGQISQGLLLPITDEIVCAYNDAIHSYGDTQYPDVDTDLTEALGIQKWERPLDPSLSCSAKGNFPSFIKKTDQERVQNLKRELEKHEDETFEVSIKLDGSSTSAYHHLAEKGTISTTGVCSRNLELKPDDNNAFWIAINSNDILNKLQSSGKSYAVQGELLSPKIQGNWERVNGVEFYAFSIWDIENGKYLSPEERRAFCKEHNIPHTPVLHERFSIKGMTIQELLAMAEGEGMNPGVKREGLVFKSNESDFSFKCISNSYLMKNKDA